MIFKVMYPFICICSPENPTNDPLKGFKSYGSRRSLLNTFQYKVSEKIPWPTRTLLTSHPSHLMVMTMGHHYEDKC